MADLSGQLGYPAAVAEAAVRFGHISDAGHGVIFVAATGQRRVVGWLHICPRYLLETDPYAEIAGLVVAEDMRGQRVGAALLSAAETWADEHGFGAVRVRSNIVRVEAHAFYEHCGYTCVKTQKSFRKEIDRMRTR